MGFFDWEQSLQEPVEQCLELEQGGVLNLEQGTTFGICLETEQSALTLPCPEIPEDACIVNYCPAPICVWPEVDEGIKAVVVIGADDPYNNCIGVVKKPALYKYPAIKVTGNDNSDYYNGAANSIIEMPLQESDNIIYPLIQDERGQLRHYRPAALRGNFRIISTNGSIRPVPDVLPAIASTEDADICPPGVRPEFYLGANVSQLICSEGQTTIQLLKIIPGIPLPPIITIP